MSKSLISNERECLVCKTTIGLHRHHIFFGAFRDKSEKWGLWCYLCGPHHNLSSKGVHNDHWLDIYMKRLGQKKFEEKYGHDLFMKEFKRNWL